MQLLRQRNGLREEENFYLCSNFSDFLGNGDANRHDGVFTLRRGEIGRHFAYQDFLIEVKKQCCLLQEKERHCFGVETNKRQIGIQEITGEESAPYWRIAGYDGYVQIYRSQDGLLWENMGGAALEDDETVKYQYFSVAGAQPLVLEDYRVYHDPFLTLQNYPEGMKASFYEHENEDGTEEALIEAFFDEKMTARLFLDYNRHGVIQITNAEGALAATLAGRDYQMGELYTATDYLLEISYKDEAIDYGPTHLDTRSIQTLGIKNFSESDYEHITLQIDHAPEDDITISLDGGQYEKNVVIDQLKAGETRQFFIKIGGIGGQFKVRDFSLTVY